MPVHRPVPRPHVGDGVPRHFMSGQPVDDGQVLRRVIRPGGHRAIAENHAARRAHDHLRLAVAVQVINRHAVAVADADGRRARFDVVLVRAVVAHVHLPEQSAVAFVGLQVLIDAAGQGQTIHDIIIFAIAVEVADPAKFHIVGRIRAARHGLQGQREILAHGGIRRETVSRARRRLDAVCDRDDIPGVRHGEICARVEIVRGVREREGI